MWIGEFMRLRSASEADEREALRQKGKLMSKPFCAPAQHGPTPDCCATWTRSATALGHLMQRGFQEHVLPEIPFNFCPWCGQARGSAAACVRCGERLHRPAFLCPICAADDTKDQRPESAPATDPRVGKLTLEDALRLKQLAEGMGGLDCMPAWMRAEIEAKTKPTNDQAHTTAADSDRGRH